MKTLLAIIKEKTALSTLELLLAVAVFAIITPGILLVFNKALEEFFFERSELTLQSEVRYTMDYMMDNIREASSITAAQEDNLIFDPGGQSYSYDATDETIYDEDTIPIPGNTVSITSLIFSYYGDDTTVPLTFPVTPGEVKSVRISITGSASQTPSLELTSYVSIRSFVS